MAASFQESLGLEAEIWVDRDRVTYQHLGFTRSVGATIFNWKSLQHGVRALRKGHRQGKTQGDPWQQGGVLVVDRAGTVVYGYASEVAGDHPPTELVLEKAEEARAHKG